MNTLQKTYFPFLISNTILFSIAIIPILGIIYLTLFLFIPAIGFSICNFIVAKDNRFNTQTLDLVTMILSIVAIIPALGWLAAAVALAFSITSSVRYRKWKKRQLRNETQSLI